MGRRFWRLASLFEARPRSLLVCRQGKRRRRSFYATLTPPALSGAAVCYATGSSRGDFPRLGRDLERLLRKSFTFLLGRGNRCSSTAGVHPVSHDSSRSLPSALGKSQHEVVGV
jgi:hypothetical protein